MQYDTNNKKSFVVLLFILKKLKRFIKLCNVKSLLCKNKLIDLHLN